MSYRRNRGIQKTLKDYIVPIIGGVIVLLLLVNVFSGDDTASVDGGVSTEENTTALNVSLYGDSTEAYVEYTGGNRKLIESDISLFKGEKVVVKEGNVTIGAQMLANFVLGRGGDFSYLESGNFALDSADLWVTADTPTILQMRYAKLHIGDNSVLSLTQNEVNSIVYLLQGSVEIENLAGKSTVLAPKQKLVISRSDASNDDVDLSLQKTQIDEYFIGSDWFIRNHGLQYLTAEASATGTTDTVSMSSKIVTLDTIQDEARVSSASIDVKGKYTVETVRAIKINGKNAEMDTGAKTFTVSGVDTSKKENDLVVKVYGADDELIAKYVYTVYYDSAASSATSTDLFKVENFSLDSTKFKFISPTTNPYTTTASMVTIEGMVPANTVAKILVNDFQLQKFPKNGTYWKYHANVEWGNLKPGLNIYKVDYYGNNGELLHSNAFTIVKPAATPAPAAVTPKEESSPISGEA